ncbi:MAG TPA: SIMPL domain-containing protein [Clostridia bacterium]|nr:SIMPL domain-containing protein [Clostridia bacterium]
MDSQIIKKYLIWVLVACILVSGLVWSSYIVTNAITKINSSKNVITVTGSAKKKIKSDFAMWNGDFSATYPSLSEAYGKMKADKEKVNTYLINKGVKASEISFATITTEILYVMDANGQRTNKVESYKLTQTVKVASYDIDKVGQLALDSMSLINQGITFNSNSPQYIYTKLADLKIDMLGLATKDTKNRASTIAKNSGAKVGKLVSSKVGVFQITPLYSTDTSDYGINDTSTVEKEITAVMTCDFEIIN